MKSKSLILVLVLATALGPLAMSSFLPAIPEIQTEFQTSSSVAQLTMSVSMLMMAVFSLLYGSMSDRFGRRPVILFGVSVAVVGSLLCAFAPSITWAIIGRALQAAGATSGMILTRVIVHDLYGDKRAAGVLGYIVASMTIAPLLGPALGGLVIEYYSWRYVFFAIAVYAALLFVALVVKVPETRPHAMSAREVKKALPVAEFVELFRLTQVRQLILFAAIVNTTFMAFLGGVPYLISIYYELPASLYAFYVVPVPIGFALGGLLTGRYGDNVDRFQFMKLAAAVSVAAVLLSALLLMLGWDSPWAICLPTGIVAIATSACLPVVQTEAMSRSGDLAGSSSGLMSFSQLVLGAAVAQFVGWSATFGPVGVVATMLLCSSCALLMVLFGIRVKSKA